MDKEFRRVVAQWYGKRRSGEIKSANFQLHPPRNKDHDVVRSSFGHLVFPLLLYAERSQGRCHVVRFDDAVLKTGSCKQFKP